MWSPPRDLSWKLRTKWKNIDEPTGRFCAERKVCRDSFSESDVGVIIANVNPISDIHDDSGCEPG